RLGVEDTVGRHVPPRASARSAHWRRRSGTASIAKNWPRGSGPTARSRSAGVPARSITARAGVTSRPVRRGPARPRPRASRAALSGSDGRHQALVQVWRQPVPMDVPPRAGMRQEAATTLRRPTLPEPLVVGPQAIDGAAPIATGRFRVANQLTKPAPEGAEIG